MDCGMDCRIDYRMDCGMDCRMDCRMDLKMDCRWTVGVAACDCKSGSRAQLDYMGLGREKHRPA